MHQAAARRDPDAVSLHPERDAEPDPDRARRLIFALSAAERTLEMLSPALRRAIGYERRPRDRRPGIVRQEVELASRLAAELRDRLDRARAALPPRVEAQHD